MVSSTLLCFGERGEKRNRMGWRCFGSCGVSQEGELGELPCTTQIPACLVDTQTLEQGHGLLSGWFFPCACCRELPRVTLCHILPALL